MSRKQLNIKSSDLNLFRILLIYLLQHNYFYSSSNNNYKFFENKSIKLPDLPITQSMVVYNRGYEPNFEH